MKTVEELDCHPEAECSQTWWECAARASVGKYGPFCGIQIPLRCSIFLNSNFIKQNFKTNEDMW